MELTRVSEDPCEVSAERLSTPILVTIQSPLGGFVMYRHVALVYVGSCSLDFTRCAVW